MNLFNFFSKHSFISKESAPTAVESYIICEKNLGNKSVILRENNKKEIKTDRQNKNRDYHNNKRNSFQNINQIWYKPKKRSNYPFEEKTYLEVKTKTKNAQTTKSTPRGWKIPLSNTVFNNDDGCGVSCCHYLLNCNHIRASQNSPGIKLARTQKMHNNNHGQRHWWSKTRWMWKLDLLSWMVPFQSEFS